MGSKPPRASLASRIAAGRAYLSAHIHAPGVFHAPGGALGMTIDAPDGDPVIAAFVQACPAVTGLEAKASPISRACRGRSS